MLPSPGPAHGEAPESSPAGDPGAALTPPDEQAASALDERDVLVHLRRRALLALDGPVGDVRLLGGGVSNVVLLVEAGADRFVVKQPRARLLVEDEWLATAERVVNEATALRWAEERTPEAVPPVVDLDEQAHILVMEAAPPSWQAWKDLLLAGVVDPAIGERLGAVLGTWHRQSSIDTARLAPLGDLEAFVQLRIDPFHRTVASRHPELAGTIEAAAGALLDGSSPRCFVHGDFSPKNVLVGTDGLWVIDFEVGHLGNPVFDLAFLTTHLLLKALHRPGDAANYRACARAFLDRHGQLAGADLVPSDESLAIQVGCLLLARVDGKSPAEYLTAAERVDARNLGLRLLHEPVHPLAAWPAP